MKYFAALIMLLSCLANYAQSNLVKITVTNNHEDYNYTQHLPDIAKSAYKYYIRYEISHQITDLYSNDSINFKGMLLNHIEEPYSKTSELKNHIYNITDLDIEACSKVGYKILKDKLHTVPTDTLITGYENQYNDCGNMSFTFKINELFIKTTYTCPWFQVNSLPQLKLLKTNYTYIDSVLQLKEGYNKFTSKLEKGKYYSLGLFGIYIKTNSEMHAWEKAEPERQYLKSVKDTITHHLRAEINKIYHGKDDFTCTEYNLNFNKSGKLVSIRTNDAGNNFLARLFNNHYHKCRKRIKQLFKDISLKHLNLKYGFTRQISFYKEDFYISDLTVY